MTVVDGDRYILVASQGGAPKNPFLYYNLKTNPNVEIRDGVNVYSMKIREIEDEEERQRLWCIAVRAFPPYLDYQKKKIREQK